MNNLRNKGAQYITDNLNDAIALNRYIDWKNFCDFIENIVTEKPNTPIDKIVDLIDGQGHFTMSIGVYRKIKDYV